jgi:hypothetical protein
LVFDITHFPGSKGIRGISGDSRKVEDVELVAGRLGTLHYLARIGAALIPVF